MPSVFSLELRRDELNERMGGGLPQNSFVLLEAPNAVGKSILAQRFTFGLLSNNTSVTYVSTELSLSSFMNQMNSLDYGVVDKLMSDQLFFVSIFSSLGDVKQGASFIKGILGEDRLFQKDVIIFDTFSDLLFEQNTAREYYFEILHAFKKITSMGKTIVFCVDPERLNPTCHNLLRNISEVYLRLQIKEQFGVMVTSLNIDRFVGAASDVTTENPFKIKAGVGIIVETASAS